MKAKRWNYIQLSFPDMPLGAMPVLEYDGLVLAQSLTIARFLAKKAKLTGTTDEEAAKADMVVDTVVDYYDSEYKIYAAFIPVAVRLRSINVVWWWNFIWVIIIMLI